MGIFGRRKQVDPDERSSQLGLKHKDLAVMGALLDAGANFDEPRHVVHYSYFPDAPSAQAAGRDLATHGWSTEVREPLPDHPGSWTLVCEQQDLVLTPALIRDSTDLFEAVAARHRGD